MLVHDPDSSGGASGLGDVYVFGASQMIVAGTKYTVPVGKKATCKINISIAITGQFRIGSPVDGSVFVIDSTCTPGYYEMDMRAGDVLIVDTSVGAGKFVLISINEV